MISSLNAAERRAFGRSNNPICDTFDRAGQEVQVGAENLLSSREGALQTLHARLSGA